MFVWRSNDRTKVRGWIGPGSVVLVAPNGTSIWVSMRGHLLKCSAEQVRLGTDEEHIGAEVAKLLSQESLAHLRRSGQRGFIDVQRVGAPDVRPQGPRGGVD